MPSASRFLRRFQRAVSYAATLLLSPASNAGNAVQIPPPVAVPPFVCGTDHHARRDQKPAANEILQDIEVIPSVFRAGTDTPIYVYFTPHRTISSASIVFPTDQLDYVGGTAFRDDGKDGDQAAGDGIYTLGPLYVTDPYSEQAVQPYQIGFGTLRIVEADESLNIVGRDPTLAVIPKDWPDVHVTRLSDKIQYTGHIINLKQSVQPAQRLLRFDGIEATQAYGKALYSVLEDKYDFLIMLSSGLTTAKTASASGNGTSGLHMTLQRIAFTPPYPNSDQTAHYGSAGRLFSICALDYQIYGMYPHNLVHEIMHRWGAYFEGSLGFTDGTGHYRVQTNVGSPLGGKEWQLQSDGSYLAIDNSGRAGGYRAGPTDLVSMGILPLEQLHDIYYAPSYSVADPNKPIAPTDITRTVTPAEIRNVQGSLLPDFANPQTKFGILFAIESKDRLLTQTEMAYYHAFVAEAMRHIPEGEPDPFVGHQWASITRFFGDRVALDNAIYLRNELFDADLDPDKDGYTTAEENLLGLDPLWDGSCPRIQASSTESGIEIAFYPYRPELEYTLESSLDNKTWLPRPDALRKPAGTTLRLTVPLDANALYRVAVSSSE